MGNDREKELLEHGDCVWQHQYLHLSTRRDKIERQLEACDAGKKKMVQTICPFFLPGKPFEFPLPNGRCAAADNEVCQMKCGKRHWELKEGKLVKV